MNTENLLKLASYLEALPTGYGHFSMAYFHNGLDKAHSAVGAFEYLPFKPEHLAAAEVHTCGSAACAIGHGPSAGIPLAIEDRTWWIYSERVFDLEQKSDEWNWCFAGDWDEHDNTAKGAAARIRALVAGDMGVCPWIEEAQEF